MKLRIKDCYLYKYEIICFNLYCVFLFVNIGD